MADDVEEIRAELADGSISFSALATLRIAATGRLAGVPYMTVPSGNRAVNCWRQLRGLTYGRRYPVIVDEADDVPLMSDRWLATFGSVEQAIATGRDLDSKGRWMKVLAEWIDQRTPEGSPPPPRSAASHQHGQWPERTMGRHEFAGPSHIGFHPQPTVDVVLPACTEPWMAPAHLRAEPHNDLADAAVQCAVFRSWFDRFAAEVVYANDVVYEFAVGRPPAGRDAAMELAYEHFLFCPDRVNQVCPDGAAFPSPGGTLEGLAAMLMESSVWYFWWD